MSNLETQPPTQSKGPTLFPFIFDFNQSVDNKDLINLTDYLIIFESRFCMAFIQWASAGMRK